jgi:hypothetical protein
MRAVALVAPGLSGTIASSTVALQPPSAARKFTGHIEYYIRTLTTPVLENRYCCRISYLPSFCQLWTALNLGDTVVLLQDMLRWLPLPLPLHPQCMHHTLGLCMRRPPGAMHSYNTPYNTQIETLQRANNKASTHLPPCRRPQLLISVEAV